ncbi:MAG TPA: alkaline phosphatase family protein [Streptosporangiaceae bacterium]|nr:alkaline phosphatase family protein [Streptosporangiaceae bacterium]
MSFLKPPAYQDAHAGYSDPLDEQRWIVTTIDQIEKSPFWSSTAVVVTYDDSDGWYDFQASSIQNGSDDASLDSPMCMAVPTTLGTRNDRCGFGPRLPMLVISPWTKQNFVSHTRIDTDSVLSFIEDNWGSGKRIADSYDAISAPLDSAGLLDFKIKPHLTPIILDPKTGEIVPAPTVTSVKPASGTHKGGTKVTISGKNFTGTTTVLFGKKKGTKVKVVSAAKITVISPAGTGTVHVVVTATGGSSSSTSAVSKFTYK